MAYKIQLKVRAESLKDTFDEFLNICKVKNLAETTIEYYTFVFSEFEKYVGDKINTEYIDSKLIQDYTLHLLNSHPNRTTVNNRLRGIRVIINYFIECEYIKEVFKVKMVKQEKTIKDTYTQEELDKLLQKPNLKKCKFAEYRNWVIVNYLLATGNRQRTVINIKIKDIDLANSIVKLTTTKNRNQQIIPIPSCLIIILKEYMTIRKGSDEDYLFCNSDSKKLCKSSFTSLIRSYCLKRNVRKTSTHQFRHTFAKMWIQNRWRYV